MVRTVGILVFSCFLLAHARGSETADSSYEITGYHFSLRILPTQNGIVCRDTITIHRFNTVRDSITLRFPSFYEVENFFLNGRQARFQAVEGRWTIHDLPGDTMLQCVIAYSGTIDFRSEFSRLTRDRAVLREEEFLPSSYGSRKITSLRMSITVPQDWTVLAPGDVVHEEIVDDSLTRVFSLETPIPMIGWICAGNYTTTTDSVVSVSLYREDSSASAPLVDEAKKILAFYSDRFLPYRFHHLKIVEVDDWVAGRNVLAIAIPSMIFVKKTALTTETKFDRVEAILPHEIAHQWWPMTVFIRDEDAALLSEGMCEYSALLFSESIGKLSARDSLRHHPLLRPLIMRIENKTDLPLRQKADLRSVPTQYLKSSFVHNMLRKVIGDSAFFRLYHEWASRYALQLKTQDDFQHLAEELSHKQLGWFFDQWTTSRGVPELKIYHVKSEPVSGGWLTQGRVRLLGYEKYTTPVEVAVECDGKLTKETIWLGTDSSGLYHNDVGFEIRSGKKPVRAVLDPSGDLLKIQKLPVKLSDLRDPGDGIMIVGTKQAGSYLLDLARSDSSAMDRAAWSITIKPDTAITLVDLQQERVILYGTAGENSVVANLENKFPYHVVRDSIEIGKETVFDSTLALMQCIESPYISRGLLVWVAPLSERAQPQLLPYESSWSVVKGKEEISSGTWEEHDEDLSVTIK
jgi:hypothetical protein